MEVIAFVGPSGSGKSHRAIGIAHQYNCDAIIDDGLLIQGTYECYDFHSFLRSKF